jgi:hypothetical protein
MNKSSLPPRIKNAILFPLWQNATPAVAAGVEYERWSLERAVEMAAEYVRRKEDAEFETAFASKGL